MKYFSLYVLLLAGLTLSAQAQLPDFMQRAKNWFGGVKQTVMNKMFSMDEFSKVNDTVRNILRSGDLSSLDTNTVGQMPEKLWQAVGIGPMLTLGKTKLNALLSFDKIKSKGLRTQIENYIAANVSREEAIPALAIAYRSQGSQGKIQLLLTRLDPPEYWTVESIKNMSQILFYLPNEMIMKMQDMAALRELNRQVTLCIKNSNNNLEQKSNSCPTVEESKGTLDNVKSRRMTGLRAWLLVKVYGDPSAWSIETLAMMDLEALPGPVLTSIQPNVLASKKTEIITMLTNIPKKRDMIGRIMVEKFMTAENVMLMNADQVKRFQSFLGQYLGLMLYSTDVSQLALQDVQLNATLRANDATAIRTGGMSAKLVKTMVQNLASMKNVTAIQARTMGLTAFSLAPADMLSYTVRNMNPSKQEMKDLAEGIAATAGPAAKGKLRSVAPSILSAARLNGGLDLQMIPKMMYDMIPLSDINNMDKNSAKLILNDMPPSVQPAQISALITKLGSSEQTSLNPNAKAALSASQARQAVTNLGATAATSLADGMPASSPLGMMAATETFGKLSVVSVKGKLSLVPFMGAAEAMKVDTTRIMETLDDMDLAQPTREACFVLKEKFLNYSATTLGTSNEDEAFALVTASDIEKMPPCVVAAFGMNRLMSMSEDMKVALFDRVVDLNETLFTNNGLAQDMAEMIIDQGFKAMNKPLPLTGVDVEDMGLAVLLAPADYLDSITADAAPDAIALFNALAARPIMPCLDGRKLGAIRNLIYKSMNNVSPSLWVDISKICCLLYTLPASDLYNIPDGSLSTCTCDMMDENRYKSNMEVKKMLCGGALGAEMAAKASVKEAQMRAVFNLIDPANLPARTYRRKRAVGDLSICSRAAVSGVDSITQVEINNLSNDDLNSCLSGLGSKYMDSIKAAALANKMIQNVNPRDYSSLNAQNLTDMGFILRGISDTDIPRLPSLYSPDFSGVVMRLGNPDLMLSQEQLNAYAKKVVGTWKVPLSSWTAADIATVNRLLCGMTSNDITQFTAQNFRDAVPFVEAAVTGCDMQTIIMPLANETFQAYGDPMQWTKAQVREMGQLFAGLSPDAVGKISAEAATGITPGAVNILPLSLASAMTAGQLLNMEASSARLFSPEQVSRFSPEMRAALSVTLSRSQGGAASVIVSVVLVSIASVVTLLL